MTEVVTEVTLDLHANEEARLADVLDIELAAELPSIQAIASVNTGVGCGASEAK